MINSRSNIEFHLKLTKDQIPPFQKVLQSSRLANSNYFIFWFKRDELKVYTTPISRDFQIVSTFSKDFFQEQGCFSTGENFYKVDLDSAIESLKVIINTIKNRDLQSQNLILDLMVNCKESAFELKFEQQLAGSKYSYHCSLNILQDPEVLRYPQCKSDLFIEFKTMSIIPNLLKPFESGHKIVKFTFGQRKHVPSEIFYFQAIQENANDVRKVEIDVNNEALVSNQNQNALYNKKLKKYDKMQVSLINVDRLKSLRNACENCGEHMDVVRLEVPVENWTVNNEQIGGHSFTFVLQIMESINQVHNIIGNVDQ